MLIVTGVVEIDPAKAEAAKSAAIAMSQATRLEDGCLEYAFWQSIESPGQFRVYEEWRDADALKAHAATPHMAEFRAALAGFGVIGTRIVTITGGKIAPL